MIFTIGHGTRSTDELVTMLKEARVEILVDVRRFPGSRRNPHLGRLALAKDLPAFGITYLWQGNPLGGRRRPLAVSSRHPAWRNASFRSYADHTDTPEFRDALAALHTMGDAHPTAFMCAETLWWRCHRRIISDALTVAGAEVVHLLGLGKRQPHVPHPAIRVEDGCPVYDRGCTLPLRVEADSAV